MLRHLASLPLLVSATAFGAVVFDDTNPSASDWFAVYNVNVGPSGFNLNPTLTDGASLRFATNTYTSAISTTTHLFDNTYVMRRFSPQALAVGAQIVLEFNVTAPTAGNNAARGTRNLTFRLIGSGAETLPTATTTFGTVDTVNAVPNDTDLTLAGNSAINLGAAVSLGNVQNTFGTGNTATANVGSNKLFSAGGGSFSPTSTNFASAWTGSRVVFEVERLANLTNSAAFQLTTRLYEPDNTTLFATMVTTTTNNTPTSNFGTGPILFDGIAIGAGTGGQFSLGQSGYVDFTLDNISLNVIPEPSAYAALAGLLALGLALRPRSGRR